MFTVEDHQRVERRILEMASNDPRIVAGAVVGSRADSDGDRWSDLDLTFAVADGVAVCEVLEDWTQRIVAEFDAVRLFDFPRGSSIYRVFLLQGCLQFDLSFTPAADFGAIGPKFRLLFGSAVEKPHTPPPRADELFGYAVHHVLRARFCIERGRSWHAEYWLSAARDEALHLACLHRGLPAVYGRGFDDLPSDVLSAFDGSLVRSLDRDELLRALAIVINGLLREAEGVCDAAAKVEPRLRELAIEWEQSIHLSQPSPTRKGGP
jgi:hypothetical protein